MVIKITIKIYLLNGEKDEWADSEYDDYQITGNFFVVMRKYDWVGIYPLDNIYKIIVK